MLASLSPVGERGRGQRWWVTTAAYVVGSVLGAVATGGLLAAAAAPAASRLPEAAALAAVAAAAAAGLAADLVADRRRTRLPGPRRQVDRRWLDRYRGWVYGAGFGVQLGLGWTTIVARSVTYAWMAAAALSGSPAAGAALGAAYGLARSLPLLLTLRVRDAGALRRLHRRLDAWRGRADAAALAGQSAVAAAAALGSSPWS